jgi:hypothetical protein
MMSNIRILKKVNWKVTNSRGGFMKQTLLIALVLILALWLQGCDETINKIVSPEKLSPPLGLKSITGDEEITLLWYTSNYESDLSGYFVYQYIGSYSTTSVPEDIPSSFTKVDSLTKSSPSNTIQSRTITGLENGTTYSFLVVAVKNDWSEQSQPSNIINDTPRKETQPGSSDTIWASSVLKSKSGYEFLDFSVSNMNDIHTPGYYTDDGEGDFICERINFEGGVEERLWLAGTNNGGVMDLGYMQDWNDADMAPSSGYAATGYSLTAIPGHVYAVKTGDNHYGKIQVINLNVDAGWVSFKACYQTQAGNRQYKPKP